MIEGIIAIIGILTVGALIICKAVKKYEDFE